MEIALLSILVVLTLIIIFFGLRCNQYKKAYMHQIRAMHKLVESNDMFEEAIATMMAVYELDEDEIIRRLLA